MSQPTPNHSPTLPLIRTSDSTLSTENTQQPTSVSMQSPTPPPLTQRKITKEELLSFTKRLKHTLNTLEPIFHDPITSTLSPHSKIQSFIVEESFKPQLPFSPKVRRESLKVKARIQNIICSDASVSHVGNSSNLTDFTAEEAGLTMPPPLP